jgi:hypothetical protein
MIVKQRKVGGSIVFTVSKDLIDQPKIDGTVQYYDVTKTEKGEIVYSPVEVILKSINGESF